jgi:Holliday junction resolvase RusA-like endonuclease
LDFLCGDVLNEKSHANIRLPNANMEPTPGDGMGQAQKGQRIYPSTRCRIVVYSYRHRDTDPDGISAKALLDAIIKAGIHQDDSSKFCESFTSKVIKIKKTDEEKTVLEIEYLDD